MGKVIALTSLLDEPCLGSNSMKIQKEKDELFNLVPFCSPFIRDKQFAI